jgi:multiple sugar transport system permease protein
MTPRARRRLWRNVLIYLGLAPFVVAAVFPVYWMAITAFKEEADLYRKDVVPFWFHSAPTLKNFYILFTQSYFAVWFVNTMLLSICLVAITLATAVPAGYALSRLRLPGAGNLGIAMFMTYLVPPIIIFLPLARIVGTLGLFDSWWALVVVYPTFTIPFCTWILTGFFIAAIFTFTLAMQESLYAVVYVAPRDQTTVTVGVATALIRGDIYYWGSLMAAGLIVGLPVAVLYSLFVDHFIRGLTASGTS